MKKLKDKEYPLATIKVWVIKERTSEGKGCVSQKDKMFIMQIKFPTYTVCENFPATRKGKSEMYQFMKEYV